MNSRSSLPALLLALSTVLPAQDFEAPVVTPPTGYFDTPSPFMPTTADVLRGFEYGIGTSFIYDSNIFQAPDTALMPATGDMIYTVSPTIAYRTQGSRWSLGANAGLDYRGYFDHSDLNGLGYDTGANFSYNGRPLTATGSVSYGLAQGANRFYGSPSVQTHTFATSLGAAYQWSAKTSFDARYSYRWSEPDQAAFGTTETTSFDLSALWKATPLVTVGPGVAWSSTSGDTQPGRQTIGPILRLQYQLASKVALDGTFGLDFVEYDGGGDADPAFSTRLGVSYRASPLWSMNLSVFNGTTADGAIAGTYRETTSIRLGYNRKIRRASLGVGVSYEMDDYTTATGTTVGGGSNDFFSFDTSLGMAVLRNRAHIATFFAWRDESGIRDWSGYQLGVSLSSKF